MAANSSIILSNLDFDTLKNTFKSYLRSQDRFNDYDFEGSNLSVLLDLLSYNTYHNAFYLNMIGNEMFLDSAQLRDSVVSHAKELNYTPRSFKSAQANVTIVASSTDTGDFSKRSIVIPKGTTFSSQFLNRNYSFSVDENIVIARDQAPNNDIVSFTGENITLYEGYYLSDTYTYAYSSVPKMLVSNRNVDISSISINVIEDAGATSLVYNRATSLFDLDSTSQIFFVQGAENDGYEIVFGDGVTGRRPKNNSVIVIEYRVSNGELPNGCIEFKADTTFSGISEISVITNSAAAGGSVSESIDSIKFNAPRHFTAQERAITTEDYETLLRLNFPEVNAVTAYGGEDLNPPQFGKVFVSVDLIDVDGLPDIKKTQYYNFLKPRSPVSIDPVFVNADYTYLGITSKIKYNVNVTRLTQTDIKTIVSSAILNYSQTDLNNFNRTFRYSKLVRTIDNSQSSIISNETDVTVIKIINPDLGVFRTFDVAYNIPLDIKFANDLPYSVESTVVVYNGQRALIKDDGQGNINIISYSGGQILSSVGTINYDTGLLQFSNLKLDNYIGSGIKLYATPKNKDVSTINNVILNIVENDISLTVDPIRA